MWSMKSNQQKLSIFVDESGSFLYPDNDSRFYVIGMVFHDQSIDIRQQLTDMDRSIDEIGLDPETFVFHAGPLIRREQGYEFLGRRLRERVFARMMTFARKVDFKYKCISADKRYVTSPAQLAERLTAELLRFVESHKTLLERLDAVKVYYDCGQSTITNILTDVFGKQRDLNACHRGDLLAIRTAGAYGEIMASCYNCRPLPTAIISDDL